MMQMYNPPHPGEIIKEIVPRTARAYRYQSGRGAGCQSEDVVGHFEWPGRYQSRNGYPAFYRF
jgi:hypothetical protein